MNVVVSWSGGKDSAWAFYRGWHHPKLTIRGLLTTVTENYQRISIHGIRREILLAQAEVVGLPVFEVFIPPDCPNTLYEERVHAVLTELARSGIEAVIFGDIFLEDVRAYREQLLARAGLKGLFPIWGEDTHKLALEMITCGLQAWTTCVDGQRLDAAWVGREFSYEFIDSLPPDIDPCGENGEFHTLVTNTPYFKHALSVKPGEIVLRDRRFWYCDFTLEPVPQ